METAVAYCRVSDIRQADQGNSLVTQEKQVHEYAQRSGYMLDRVFVERGESAKTDDRLVLKEMLAYCQKNRGKIQVVVIPKIDRLARNRDDYGALKAFLARLQIRLDSIGERIEDTPVGRFTESILASSAQFDNEIRAERCKGGMVEAVREGRWVWLAPKGYRNVRLNGKGTIAPDERLGPVMKETFERIASGSHSSRAVCQWLQVYGLRFTVSRLHKVLHNKVYMGVIESFGLIQPGSPPFVPLVTPETFFRAQEALRRKSAAKTYERDNPDFPLRGTLVCECGKHFTACWSEGYNDRYAYYRCLNCVRTNYPRSVIEQAFQRELGEYRFTQPYIERIKEAILRRWEERFAEEMGRAERVGKEIEEVKALQGNIALKNASGVIPDDLAKQQINQLGARIAALAEEQRRSLPTKEELTTVTDFATAFLSDMPSWWASSTLAEQKKLQSFLYPRGLVYTKDGRFRTADYPHLEEIKGAAYGGQSTVVDPDDDFTNRLLQFLKRLSECFSFYHADLNPL